MKLKTLIRCSAIFLLLGFNPVAAEDRNFNGVIPNIVIADGASDDVSSDVGGGVSNDQNRGSTMFSGVGSAVDGAHESVNARFNSFVIQVDDFIGSKESVGSINKSWARVRVDTIKTAVGGN